MNILTPSGLLARVHIRCARCGTPLVEVVRDCDRDPAPHRHAHCPTESCRALMPQGWAMCVHLDEHTLH